MRILIIGLAITITASCADWDFEMGAVQSSPRQISLPAGGLDGDPQMSENPDLSNESAATFGLYAETVPISVNWDQDTKLDIWQDWNGNMNLEETASSNAPEGQSFWKLTGTGAWLGMGIRVEPLSNTRDLREFTNGTLRFYYKGLHHFKVGLQDDRGTEKWVYSRDLAPYGFTNDNRWHEIKIPMSFFNGLSFRRIRQYFMFVANGSLGYNPGNVYHLDKIHFHSRNPYPSGGYQPSHPVPDGTPYVLFSDTIPFSVEWDADTRMDVWRDWSGNMDIAEVRADDVPEGQYCWKITGTGDWMGMGIRVNPLSQLVNMNAYSNGSLVFWMKGNRGIFEIGLKSQGQKDIRDRITLLFGSRHFGDQKWHLVVIPMRNFKTVPELRHTSTFDPSRMEHYFMFSSEPVYYIRPIDQNIIYVYEGYRPGDVVYLDGILFVSNTNLAEITNRYGNRELNMIPAEDLVWAYTVLMQL